MTTLTDPGVLDPSAGPAEAEPSRAESSNHSLQVEQAVQAVAARDVDALFVSGTTGERLITLNGADRACRLLIEGLSEGAVTLTPTASSPGATGPLPPCWAGR